MMSESKEKAELAAKERYEYEAACINRYQLYSMAAVMGLLSKHGYEPGDVVGEADRLATSVAAFALAQMTKADEVVAGLMKAYDEPKEDKDE